MKTTKFLILTALLIFTLATSKVKAQTVPTAQQLIYQNNFSTLSTSYPTGIMGWKIWTSSTTSFRADSAISDLSISNGSASSTSGGIYNFNEKIGFLATGSLDPSIVICVNTTEFENITMGFDVMTIRNPYDGTTYTRRNNIEVQYRIGNTNGTFTSLTGSIYRNNTTTQTSGTTPQNLQTLNINLPTECDNQAIIQIRFVQRDSIGSGSRPSFAFDNITISGTAIQGGGSSGNGWAVSGNDVILDESGNVGIGTDSPSQKLDVTHSDTTGGIAINQTISGANAHNEIRFNKNGLQKWAIGNDLFKTGKQTFFIWDHVGGKTRFYIDSLGNVAIGKTNAFSKLDVEGDIRINDYDLYLSNHDVSQKQHGVGWYGPSGTYHDQTKLFANDSTINGPVLYGYSGGALGSKTSSSQSNQKIAIRWDNNGRVAIGSIAPSQKFEVQHSDTLGGIAINQTISGANAHSEIQFKKNGIEKWAIGNDLQKNGKQTFFIWDHVNGKTRFYIDTTGNVAIGKSNAISKLDVNGDIRINDYDLYFSNHDVSQKQHGVGWYGPSGTYHDQTKLFANDSTINGPVLYGYGGGALGTKTSSSQNDQKIVMRWNSAGKIGIGTEIPENSSYTVFVEGGIQARDVRVKTTGWADYVFDNKYNLMTISELEKYIKENKHLPGIPAEAQITSEGFEIGTMQQKLLEKVEEQALYIIDLQKQLDEVKQMFKQNK